MKTQLGNPPLEDIDHALINLDSDDVACGLKKLDSEVAAARVDLEDGVSGSDTSLPDDGVEDVRVGENVLPPALVKVNPMLLFFASSFIGLRFPWLLLRFGGQ